jgi:hypothetical protein
LVYTKVSEREGGTREGHEGFANREVAWSDISRGMKREQPQTNDELQMQTLLATVEHADDHTTGITENPSSALRQATRGVGRKT